tara:strand:- start:2351 stop:2836 length:486 start_codon:yes stop_codon:yes gene_type:complete
MMINERKINLPIGLVKKLITPLFDPTVRKKEFIIDALLSMMTDQDLEMLMELLNKDKYTPFDKGMHVKFKPNPYFIDDYDQDILEDKGLLKDQMLYGIIKEDDSYLSGFNPYNSKMRVDVYVWDNNKLETTTTTIKTLKLIKCTKISIPYFKKIDIDKAKV